VRVPVGAFVAVRVGVTVPVAVCVGVRVMVAVGVTVGLLVTVGGVREMQEPPVQEASNTTAHPPHVPAIGAAQKLAH
jgi:hypothetical protein